MVKDRLAELQEKHVADIIAKDTEESTEDDVPEMPDRSPSSLKGENCKFD
jgi:hypothetical protein